MKDANGWPDHNPRTAAELLDPILGRISAGEAAEHIPFPIDRLNKLTGNGMTPGKLIVIAGHSAHGSTTLALDIARHAAIDYDVPTSLTTLTASPEEVTQRLLAAQAGVPVVRIATGTVNDSDQHRISPAAARLSAAPLRIDDNPSILSAMGYGSGTSLIVIDGAHMLHLGHLAEGAPERADEQARGLKRAALGDENAIVVTVPLTGGHGRAVPMMVHFGELWPFAATADMVLLTYRPDVVEREDPRAGEIDITVAKHRNGPTGVVTACAQTHYSRIVDFPK